MSKIIEFKLVDRDFLELCNVLKAAGLCESGGMAKNVIASGEVKVNGIVETRKRCKITAGQSIEYLGETIKVS
jgi:ribosome-associated protein